MADLDIRLGGGDIMWQIQVFHAYLFVGFPVFHAYLFIGRGQVYSQTGWGPWSDFPPGSTTTLTQPFRDND